MNHLYAKLQSLQSFHPTQIKKIIKQLQKQTPIKPKQLFIPIPLPLTPQIHPPQLPNTIQLLPKHKLFSPLKNLL
ncbi:hypothetical protein [Staphylococcus epidermidis]|uniref:hypothetical protein n=1 Tax=Staphylococcus epidermidis TaxID=1282 RepID=UPI0021B4AD6B|nr:hypothetical protein [Staphylococcus epidermidis]